eukprot:6176997-Pleurochrysis_carterae.AAC.1
MRIRPLTASSTRKVRHSALQLTDQGKRLERHVQFIENKTIIRISACSDVKNTQWTASLPLQPGYSSGATGKLLRGHPELVGKNSASAGKKPIGVASAASGSKCPRRTRACALGEALRERGKDVAVERGVVDRSLRTYADARTRTAHKSRGARARAHNESQLAASYYVQVNRSDTKPAMRRSSARSPRRGHSAPARAPPPSFPKGRTFYHLRRVLQLCGEAPQRRQERLILELTVLRAQALSSLAHAALELAHSQTLAADSRERALRTRALHSQKLVQ